jgi:pimeloyl-ACP methyl ester carboxylesterase
MTIWTTEERAGLGDTAGYIQKLISVPFNKLKPDEGNFNLYYFVPAFPSAKKKPDEKKTLLFCSGGPGRVIKPHDSLWFKDLSLIGDNVVFFHLRGSGFSQLPESNKFDKYIRTRYAADDIEAIRLDFFKDTPEKPWDAVVGYSYGAVLAQQYASKYSGSLEKLILIGPISLDNFRRSTSYRKAYNEYADAARQVRSTIIDKIYKLSAFEGMTHQQKATVKEKLFGTSPGSEYADSSNLNELGIIRAIERSFGSEQIVVENYKFFKSNSILEQHNLKFELRFFEALRELQLYGWRTDNDGAVNQEEKLTEIGKIIAGALLNDLPTALPGGEKPKAAIPRTNAPRSRRVFEVMSVYDGTSKRFMRELGSNQTGKFTEAIRKASGTVLERFPEEIHIAKKIGIEEEEIKHVKPWSPRDHEHEKSTLIIAGTADPVTAGEQARSFGKGVIGKESVLLEFEGVGHEFMIPAVNINSQAVSAELRGINADTLNCLVDAFINKSFAVFCDGAKTIADRLLTEEEMGVQPIFREEPS